MAQNLDQFVKRPGADFVRNRKCPFSTLLLFLLQMEAHSLDKEIRNFFPKPASRITKSGLIQQRQKLNDKALPFLFSELNRRVPLKKKYKIISSLELTVRLQTFLFLEVTVPPRSRRILPM
jgi:hypothetical protein